MYCNARHLAPIAAFGESSRLRSHLSGRLAVKIKAHDLGGFGDVGLLINFAPLVNKLKNKSRRMMRGLREYFDNRAHIATLQALFR